jgi:PAS domain S-box-containing protein
LFCLILVIAAIGIQTYSDQVEARQKSARYLRKIIDTADSLIFVKDREGHFLQANLATARFFGTTVDGMIGKTDEDFRFLDSVGQIPHLHDEDAEVIHSKKEIHSETALFGADTQIHWFTTAKVPMLNPDGACDSVLVVATDISERKKAEESLKEYAERLQRSNEDLQRFAYIASHDLQEPLRSIVSYSQMLDRRYRGKLDADADEFLEYIVEGGLRMQMLIQDVLAFSCINASEPRFTETDTEAVLTEVEESLAEVIQSSGVTITHEPLPVVMADRMQMVQLFTNLISNAVKFHRPGVVPMIHIRAGRIGPVWEFSVADNGIGIEPEYFERIFVIFQRLHTRQEYEGTGIGLAIARKILDRHGGQIRVTSTVGRGTTFYFTLPVIAA